MPFPFDFPFDFDEIKARDKTGELNVKFQHRKQKMKMGDITSRISIKELPEISIKELFVGES